MLFKSLYLNLMLCSSPFFALLMSSCGQTDGKSSAAAQAHAGEWCIDGITEFRRGDIIVKPNLNILPGTLFVPGGAGFGHAALVVKGFSHRDTDSLLANTIIVESIAKDVPREFQIREILALKRHRFDAFNNTNFDGSVKGRRYRLRLNLNESQIDSIVNFALQQKGDASSWNSMKAMPQNNAQNNTYRADNNSWYCSLLVWQSVLAIAGLDLDPNGGYMVFPNDLICSPYFFNTKNHIGRVRF